MIKEIRNHKDLEVWKKSMDLVSNIYKITESFPNKELYGLTNQIRRAAVSVPSNIAEGAARLDILLEDLKFVQKLINGLIYYLKK
jgi:four helix bundle protein